MYPRRTLAIVAVFGLLATIPECVPQFANYRIVAWNRIPELIDFQSKRDAQPLTPFKGALSGHLDAFHKALQIGSTRILHYGDSPVAADQITADARDILQRDFGNAGHGFVLIAKPWAWYGHRGVTIGASGWKAEPASMSTPNTAYGLGGVRFIGAPGAISRLRFDRTHTSFEIAMQRSSGRLRIQLDGRPVATLDASGPDENVFRRVDGPGRELSIEVEGAPVTVFGVDARISDKGVVYSSLGLNGAYVSVLAKMFNERHWAAQLQHYRPDLVIVNYGTNESVYPDFLEQTYESELREVIRRLRSAVPKASILLMSPMDRGRPTVPGLLRIVQIQRRVAASTQVAFFDTFEAMGGPGTMERWYAAEPRLVSADFIHPMPAGARTVANLLTAALLQHYRDSLVK